MILQKKKGLKKEKKNQTKKQHVAPSLSHIQLGGFNALKHAGLQNKEHTE